MKNKDKLKLKSLAIHFVVCLAVTIIIPFLSYISHDEDIESLIIFSLFIVNTIVSFGGALIFSLKHGFYWLYIAMLAVVFAIVLILFFPFYQSFLYFVSYLILGLLGMLLGVQSNKITKKKNKGFRKQF